MIFNTHSHINDKSVDEVKKIIIECKEVGVDKIAAIGYDLPSSFRALNIAKTFNEVYAVCGVQPCELASFHDEYDVLTRYIDQEKCIAIGEIGLDYYYGKDNQEQQLHCFEEQLKLAIQYKKPIVIHCRDAFLDTYELLFKYKDQLDGIILHCYTGSVEMMRRFLNIGCYISLSGVVTFKNAKVSKEVAKEVPLDRLLVETDDPYLTPVPYRGQENHPAYVYYVVEEIARIKNIPIDEVAEHTYQNARKVFHL